MQLDSVIERSYDVKASRFGGIEYNSRMTTCTYEHHVHLEAA